MHILLSLLIFCFLSLAAINHDQMLTQNKNQISEENPSPRQSQEEVQLIEEEEYEPSDEQGNTDERELQLEEENSEKSNQDDTISH